MTLTTYNHIPGSMGTGNRIRQVSLMELSTLWSNSSLDLEWQCLFTLPAWLVPWWSCFGSHHKAQSIVIEDEDQIIGVAPLMIQGTTAELIGSHNVCDYLDVIVVPDRQKEFAFPLFDHLDRQGIRQLKLNGARQDAAVWTSLVQFARENQWEIICEKEDVTFEIDLPETWREFLYRLNGKQRHELRRKLRRLNEAGSVNFRLLESGLELKQVLEVFISQFRASRPDKAEFMSSKMAVFFHSLADSLTKHRILKLGVLELDGQEASIVMCFDFRSTRYLYNSGYDPQFRSLSVGLICKVLSIKDAIEREGIFRYDLLKGSETYKKQIGGASRDLWRCCIQLP